MHLLKLAAAAALAATIAAPAVAQGPGIYLYEFNFTNMRGVKATPVEITLDLRALTARRGAHHAYVRLRSQAFRLCKPHGKPQNHIEAYRDQVACARTAMNRAIRTSGVDELNRYIERDRRFS